MVTLHFDWPGGKKNVLNFLQGFIGMWTFLWIPRWLRPYCMHWLLPWAFLISPFSGSLFSSWHICILTPFLGGWGKASPWLSQSLILLFLFPPSSLVKCHDFCFCLVHVKPILYTQAPAGYIQNKHAMSLSCSESFSSFLELQQQPLDWIQGLDSRGVVEWQLLVIPSQKHLCGNSPTENVLVYLPSVSASGARAYSARSGSLGGLGRALCLVLRLPL